MLIQKPTIDASLASMIGAPVIIQHQDITEKNADELRCGAISDAYFNDIDGWYYCEGVIWDKKAQKLIDKGWSVSCSYDFLGYNDEGGVENNIKYDKEFTKLNFTHLAIVDNPRYERANIVFNSKVNNEFDESKHPRDELGKFTSESGDDSTKTSKPLGRREQKREFYSKYHLKDGNEAKPNVEKGYPVGMRTRSHYKKAFGLGENDGLLTSKNMDLTPETTKYAKQHNFRQKTRFGKGFEHSKYPWYSMEIYDLPNGNKIFGFTDEGDGTAGFYGHNFYIEAVDLEDGFNAVDEYLGMNSTKDERNLKLIKENMGDEYDYDKAVDNERDSELGGEKGKWVTIHGTHVFIRDGQTLSDAIDEQGWGKKEGKTEAKSTSDEAGESKSSSAKEISADDYTKKYGRGVDDPDNWDDSAGTRKIAKKYGFEYDKGGTYSSDGYSARVVDTMKDGHYIVGMEDEDGNTYNVDVTSIEDGFKALKDKKDGKSDKTKKSSIKPMAYDEAMKKYHFAAKASLGDDYYGESHSNAQEVMKSAKKYGFEYDGRGGGSQNLYDEETGTHALAGIGKAGDGNYVISYNLDVDDDNSDDAWKFIATKDLDASFEHIKGEFGKRAAKKSKKGNKTNNEKEQDMAIIRELKKLIKRVENNKEEQKMDEKEKIDNENVDKRKLIDEVGGILKGKVDEEVWRTVIGKLEKLSYDKSEAGSADNKKVKNEDDDKEVDNEDEKDKKEVEEVKEDVKEDVENKCKNSKFSFNKINEIYNSVKQVKAENKYVSRQDKLDSAVEYFK